MDRLDAMRIFVAALDEGSLAAAGRRLRRSPAAVTRALAGLEAHVGVKLLHRTTRAIKLTEAGERYLETCRRVLAELEQADREAAGERSVPRGLLTVTAPLAAGARILRPVLDDFLRSAPEVQARLVLLDRSVNLVDEGIDVALRIAHLPDSSLVAMRVGAVRRVVCAAPRYLKGKRPIAVPPDLAQLNAIALADTTQAQSWSFPAAPGSRKSRGVRVRSRLAVNTIEAAIGSAVDGHGVTRVYSYQVQREVRDGRLVLLLEDFEPPPLPVHLVLPAGRLALAKVRAFVDFALPRLKTQFAELAAGPRAPKSAAPSRALSNSAGRID
jgi:DNA-binding transcriptional LysR family regulator